MRTRVISAIVMIAAGGVLIYFGDIYFGAAIFLCSVIGLFEFYRAFKGKGYRPVQIIGYLYTLLIPAAIFLNPSHALDVPVKGTNLFPVFQLLVMLLLLTLTVVAHKKVTPMDCAVTLMGAFYVPFLFSFFVLIRDMDDGLALFLIGILGSVAADTVALFSGILWGRKKLIPDISPKKTVAGSIGSFVGSTLADHIRTDSPLHKGHDPPGACTAFCTPWAFDGRQLPDRRPFSICHQALLRHQGLWQTDTGTRRNIGPLRQHAVQCADRLLLYPAVQGVGGMRLWLW